MGISWQRGWGEINLMLAGKPVYELASYSWGRGVEILLVTGIKPVISANLMCHLTCLDTVPFTLAVRGWALLLVGSYNVHCAAMGRRSIQCLIVIECLSGCYFCVKIQNQAKQIRPLHPHACAD